MLNYGWLFSFILFLIVMIAFLGYFISTLKKSSEPGNIRVELVNGSYYLFWNRVENTTYEIVIEINGTYTVNSLVVNDYLAIFYNGKPLTPKNKGLNLRYSITARTGKQLPSDLITNSYIVS